MSVTIDANSKQASRVTLPPRRDERVGIVLRDWRTVTGIDQPPAAAGATLVACSGGADSVALAILLRAGGVRVALGHIVHDMRPRDVSLADRDFVKHLAAQLDVPFLESHITSQPGNAEAEARRLRYDALAELAIEARCPFIATGHQAMDQLETMVMALVRGSGPAGLSGISPSRSLARDVTLIRPMLSLQREDAEAVCREAGSAWRHDATNDDDSRLRSALRHGILAELLELRPDAPKHAGRAAELLRSAADVIGDRVEEVFGASDEWPRELLRGERRIVIGEGVRRAFLRLSDGGGADALSFKLIGSIVDAVIDDSAELRRFEMPAGICIDVSMDHVCILPPSERNTP